MVAADAPKTFGGNLSGLYYQPARRSTPGILWAVQNAPSKLYKLRWNGSLYENVQADGWSAGKTLRYRDGTGAPDAEGIALTTRKSSAIYVSAERDGAGPNRFSVLRYDTRANGTTLIATHEWDLTGDLPAVAARNLGLEAIAWVPDRYLVANRFHDERTNRAYDPKDYPAHGKGLFFVGLEANGEIYAYALNHSDSTYLRVASFASGEPRIMELSFDHAPGSRKGSLWAWCDSTCGNKAQLFGIDTVRGSATFGRFVMRRAFDRPASLPDVNNEGIAMAPGFECRAGVRAFLWADDSETDGHAIRRGAIPCGSLF